MQRMYTPMASSACLIDQKQTKKILWPSRSQLVPEIHIGKKKKIHLNETLKRFTLHQSICTSKTL